MALEAKRRVVEDKVRTMDANLAIIGACLDIIEAYPKTIKMDID